MATTNNERKHREFWYSFVKEISVYVRFDMMDRVERFLFKYCKSTGGKRSDKKRADKSRGVGNSNSVYVIPSELCISKCLVDNWINNLYMTPCRNLRHDTPICAM